MTIKVSFVKIGAAIFCVHMNQPWGDMDFDPVVKPFGITVKKAVKRSRNTRKKNGRFEQ
jgi:hypothetical protein